MKENEEKEKQNGLEGRATFTKDLQQERRDTKIVMLSLMKRIEKGELHGNGSAVRR